MYWPANAEVHFGKKVDQIIYDFHASPYGGYHRGDKTTTKVFHLGFYWSTLFKDTLVFMKKYDQCQRTGTNTKRHEIPLTNILEFKIFDV